MSNIFHKFCRLLYATWTVVKKIKEMFSCFKCLKNETGNKIQIKILISIVNIINSNENNMLYRTHTKWISLTKHCTYIRRTQTQRCTKMIEFC